MPKSLHEQRIDHQNQALAAATKIKALSARPMIFSEEEEVRALEVELAVHIQSHRTISAYLNLPPIDRSEIEKAVGMGGDFLKVFTYHFKGMSLGGTAVVVAKSDEEARLQFETLDGSSAELESVKPFATPMLIFFDDGDY